MNNNDNNNTGNAIALYSIYILVLAVVFRSSNAILAGIGVWILVWFACEVIKKKMK